MPRLILLLLLAFAFECSALATGNSVTACVADAFDFPVGTENAAGYYKARGYRPNGHLGEDWNGTRGGDTDEGDPIRCIGNGVVILARDIRLGWGNVVIVRHAFYQNGQLQYVDSLYGHLEQMMVSEGQMVDRGHQLGTMGSNRGMYDAHLHFEIRKNLAIGISRHAYARDSTNYHDPTAFILTHRSLPTEPERMMVAMNTATSMTPGMPANRLDEHARIESASPRVDSNPLLAATPNVTTNSSGKVRGAFKIDRFSDVRMRF